MYNIQNMLISDLPSPQNLLTSAVLKSPALKHRVQRQTCVPDASEGHAAVLLWYLALQTALVNGNLPSLNGSHGHIKSSVFENVVRRHKLLCPASIVNQRLQFTKACRVAQVRKGVAEPLPSSICTPRTCRAQLSVRASAHMQGEGWRSYQTPVLSLELG